MARKIVLNEDKIARIAELIAIGNNGETAAAACGLGRSTFYAYLARGRQEIEKMEKRRNKTPRKSEEMYVLFYNEVEKARGQAEATLIAYISKAAREPKSWQAAAWLVERRNPSQWGRTSRELATAEETAGAIVKLLGDGTEGDTGIKIKDV